MEQKNLEYGLKIIAVIAAITFALSYGYQFGLLTRTGLFFDEIPISIIDISKGALVATPIVVICALGSILTHATLPQLFNSSQNQNTNSMKISNKVLYSFLYILFSIFMLSLLGSIGFIMIYISSSIVGYASGRFSNSIPYSKIVTYGTIALLISASVWAGEQKASFLLAKNSDTDLVFSDGLQIKTTIIANYDAGILVVDSKRPHFIKWNEIKQIYYKQIPKRPAPICDLDDAIKEISIPGCINR